MKVHAGLDEILKGKTTDIYFKRSEEILKHENENPEVVAEIWVKHLPENYNWAVFTGLGEALQLFENKKVDIWSLPEGSPFYVREPILSIKGKYLEFAAMETPLLGFLCQASGISTKSLRCKIEAGDKLTLSFGARRMHPSITPVIDRYGYFGGMDGVSAILSAERLGLEAQGTMPHSVVLIMGDTVKAAVAFDKAVSEDVPRIILIDTFLDEKVEALRVARKLGEKLDALRIDTPYSRRGDLSMILREVREELDINGFKDVDIFVSGGIDEYIIKEINKWVDGYGIGTTISNAKTIDFSLDIVEIEGSPVAKKGKSSGMKSLHQCQRCGRREILPFNADKTDCKCGGELKSLFRKYMEQGNLLVDNESPETIRNRVLKEGKYLDV